MEPVDAVVVGMALNDEGFTAFNTIEGLGLNTFGFLWPCAGIWAPAASAVTTVWTNVVTSALITETCVN